MMKVKIKKISLGLGVVTVLVLLGFFFWQKFNQPETSGLISGNGRIEATEVDVASKLPGQVEQILVDEGDVVKSGQILAKMRILSLEAQLREGQAQQQQAENAVLIAQSQVAMRQSDQVAMQAIVTQRETELDAAQRRLSRSEILVKEGATSKQQLDDDRANVQRAHAVLNAARAQVATASAAVTAAKAQVVGARSAVNAVQATIERIQSEIDDSQLKAPRDGRVQYRVAQPGEIVAAGGKVLNLIDLSDVYMTFFVPETMVGKISLGTEVRIVLDTAPQYAIPAKVSYIADIAQFTPKTVETQSERQKLMFRVKAKIDPTILLKYRSQVKTGLPGVAWIKLDASASWPKNLANKVE